MLDHLLSLVPSYPLHLPFVHPCSRRFHTILFLMFAYFIMSWTINNIGITMACMTNSTAIALLSGMDNVSNVVDYGGTYVWTTSQQNTIVGAAFIGGLIITVFTLVLVDTASVRHMLFISVVALSACSLVLPFCAEYLGWIAVLGLRILMGAAEGLMLPGLNAMTTRWIPSNERSLGASLYTAGNQIAGLLGNPVAAQLCSSRLRWPSVFYLCGFLGLGWSILWLITVRNSPENSSWMSELEKEYLVNAIPKRMATQNKKFPFTALLTSGPFLACIAGSIATNMILTFLLVYMPVYYKDVLQLDVKANGFVSALPHVVNLISKIAWGTFMDTLKRKKVLTATAACKISQLLAMVMIACSFGALGYLVDSSTPKLAVFLLCFMACGFGFCISGFLTSLLSIAPNYIGFLSSIIQLIGFAARLFTPIMINFFKTTGTAEEWRNVMIVFVVITSSTAVMFTIWGSGEIQSWNYSGVDKTAPVSSKLVANICDNTLPLIMENGVPGKSMIAEDANGEVV